MDIADRIEPGHYVEQLSRGSAGKFAERVRSRGLEAVRHGTGAGRENVYMVTTEWLSEHPDVGYV